MEDRQGLQKLSRALRGNGGNFCSPIHYNGDVEVGVPVGGSLRDRSERKDTFDAGDSRELRDDLGCSPFAVLGGKQGDQCLSDCAAVALVDHARAERPGLDQVQGDVLGNGRQERSASTDDDRVAKHAQLVNEAELDRRRSQAGAADLEVLVGRVKRRGDLLGQ